MKNKENYSPEHLSYLKKQRNYAILVWSLRIGLLVLLFVLWQLAADLGWVDPFLTSSPSRILATIYSLYFDGTLEPYIVVLNALPKIALGPLIIIWCGTGSKAIVFMTVLVGIIIVIMHMLSAFIAVDESKPLPMRSMGATKLQTLTKLVLPSSLASFISMLKVAVGMSWIGSIMGEYIVSRAGLGYLIVYGGQVFRLDLVMAATLILCLLAAGMYFLVVLLEKILVKKAE